MTMPNARRLTLVLTAFASFLAVDAFSICGASEPTAEQTEETSVGVIDQISAEEILLAAAQESAGGRTRNWLRRRFVCADDLTCYAMAVDEPWQRTAGDRPVVIVVHGYNSSPARNQAMANAIRAAGYPCGTFAYPNDYSIAASAQLLSSQLRQFARTFPNRRVIVVCHSMGSIVARACVEDSLYDPGNVDRLIMIAPPNNGTMIAHFAIGSDVWEHWLARREGSLWRRFHDSVVDGLGEAADDLCPGSPFLAELNSRPRNPRVAYTVILGTGALMTEAELEWVRTSIVERFEQVPGTRSSAVRLNRLLANVDELVEGRGDGVVSVERGRLAGVADTLVLPFGHLAVTGEPSTAVVQEVQAAVLERLN
jgi:pimeloyl-ACP methyl ester carboxylesterase